MSTQKPSLRITTLNVGRGLKHLEKTRQFLDSCESDIVCIQDLQMVHIPILTSKFKYAQHYVPMTRHLVKGGVRQYVGIGIFSRELPFLSTSAHAYVGNVFPILDIQGIEVDEDGNAINHDLEKVRATESRLALFVEVMIHGRVFKIGTTHGTWVPEGKPDEHQRQSMISLCYIIAGQGSCVMAGDFNASRGGEIYNLLTRGICMIDKVPDQIINTLDPKNHPLNGKVQVVSDYIFTVGAVYDVSDVAVTFGVSDHGALSGTISFKD